jgi:hypothetical protein
VITVLREVIATRYVTPLREGGSLPGVVEADDSGTYVVKFRGAGQGPKALVAEIISGELARGLGLPVPELVIVHLDPVVARAEPDQEVQELIKASAGANLGMDFLPGALGYEPNINPVNAELAGRIVAFDAFTENVDRSWRNPNLLMWHRRLWMIDHGASLYFHHDWARAAEKVHRPYKWDDHVLRPYATTRSGLADELTEELIRAAVALVPEEWMDVEPGRYVEHLTARAARPEAWLP